MGQKSIQNPLSEGQEETRGGRGPCASLVSDKWGWLGPQESESV